MLLLTNPFARLLMKQEVSSARQPHKSRGRGDLCLQMPLLLLSPGITLLSMRPASASIIHAGAELPSHSCPVPSFSTSLHNLELVFPPWGLWESPRSSHGASLVLHNLRPLPLILSLAEADLLNAWALIHTLFRLIETWRNFCRVSIDTINGKSE